MQTATPQYMNLTEAAKLLPGHPASGTVGRWARQGKTVRGNVVRLRAVTGGGGKLYTTAEWVAEFLAAMSGQTVTEAAVEGAPAIRRPVTQSQIDKRAAAALASLARR